MPRSRNGVALMLASAVALMAMPSAGGEQPLQPGRLYPVRVKGLLGFIDRTGTVVIEPQFDAVQPFRGGRAVVHRSAGLLVKKKAAVPVAKRSPASGCKSSCVIDASGSVVAELKGVQMGAGIFSDGLASVKIGSQWGFIDQAGKLAIPAQFAARRWLYPDQPQLREDFTAREHARALYSFEPQPLFHEGMAAVYIGDRVGYIDKTGSVVIPPQFHRGGPFLDGLAAVEVDGKWGFIDRSGQFAIKPQYDEVGFFNVCAGAQQSSSEDEAGCYPDREGGLAPARILKKWGYIDRNGKMVIPAAFDDAGNFSEGGLAYARSGGEYGYIDRSGRFVIPPQFTDVRPFREGLAPVKVNGKWGYIDTTGKLVIPPQFNAACVFVDAVACVISGRSYNPLGYPGGGTLAPKFGYIDKRGNYIWKPQS